MDYLSKPGFLSILAGVACGVCLGWGIRGRLLRQHRARAASAGSCGTETNVMGESGEFKMVLIVRNDLKMGKGLVELGKIVLTVLLPERRNPVFLKLVQWIEDFELCEVHWLNSSSKEA
uniref:Uncharacterized protein n=1 Tax=Chrysolophus pictus TaxID=9089 RepID=A0A8C3L7H6_CHRPC